MVVMKAIKYRAETFWSLLQMKSSSKSSCYFVDYMDYAVL
jgi:hypothetical protein